MASKKTTAQVDADAQAKSEFAEVQSRIQRSEKHIKGLHDNIKRWRKLYDMKHYEGTAKLKEIRYSDPTLTNTVDLAVGIKLGNDLRWHAFGFVTSKEEQKMTGMIEKLIAGTLEINNEREERHLLYHLYLNFDRDACGVIYSVYDPELATKSHTIAEVVDPTSDLGVAAKHKFYEPPIRTQVVDPSKFFCLPGGPRRWLMMGMQEQRSVLDVEKAYNWKSDRHAHLSDEQKSTIMGKFVNAWDYAYEGTEIYVRNTIIFENQNVKGPDKMDGYEDLPYTIQFFKPTGDDSDQWHNIMTPLESSVSLLERSFNRRAYQVDVFTGLPLVIKTQPGRRVSIDPGLFNSVNISPDEEIVFPTWPGTAPDVQMQIDFLRSRIQQSGFSDVMFGSGQNQIAGYAVSQLGDQNRIRLQQPIQHLELLLTTWAKKTLRLLGYFAKDSIICVYGRQKGIDYKDEIDLADIQGYSIRAEIRPNYPNEKTRKVAMSTQVKGLLSEHTIMEDYLDIQQPEDEQKRKIIEAVMKHPVALQYALMAELKVMAEGGDEIAMMTLQSMMNQGAQNEGGRPKEPNNPEQPIGLQSPDGGPTRVAEGGEPYGQSAMDQQENMANEAPGMVQ